MRIIALSVALAFALVGCSREDEHADWPEVETLFAIQGTNVVCNGTTFQQGGPAPAPPFRWYACEWSNVRVGGSPKCYASAMFERPDTVSDWVLTFLAGHNNCD